MAGVWGGEWVWLVCNGCTCCRRGHTPRSRHTHCKGWGPNQRHISEEACVVHKQSKGGVCANSRWLVTHLEQEGGGEGWTHGYKHLPSSPHPNHHTPTHTSTTVLLSTTPSLMHSVVTSLTV